MDVELHLSSLGIFCMFNLRPRHVYASEIFCGATMNISTITNQTDSPQRKIH